MNRLLIIGDSWGAGEYSFDSVKGNHVSHPGVEEYLRSHSFFVRNLSCPGDNNIRQLRLADEELSSRKFDKIIWFQTEPLRNIYRNTPFPEDRDHWTYDVTNTDKTYDQMIEEWFTWTYNKAQEVSDKHSIKFTAIGGMTPLHPIIQNYNFFEHIIWSWAHDLVGHKPPYNTFWHTGCFIKDNINFLNAERMSKEMSACRFYEDQQEICEHFQCRHPNREAHKKLTDRILDMWNNQTN